VAAELLRQQLADFLLDFFDVGNFFVALFHI
jgi:hypothetical protein